MTGRRLVVFRADASPMIGTGHVVRCATLAQELIGRGWDAVLATRAIPDGLGALVRDAGLDLLSLPADGALDRDHGSIHGRVGRATLAVTDHYGIDASWQASAHEWVGAVMAIDDLAQRRQDVELLLDQNLGADEAAHRRLLPAGARVLAGPRFALVAPGFAEAREGRRPATGAVRRIVVFLSGADPDDVTGPIARAVAAAVAGTGIVIDVVVGAAYPFAERLQAWASNRTNLTVHVATDDMVGITAAADLAVGAPGTASWERCTLGIPTVLVTLAPNQEGVARALVAAGAAIAAGGPGSVDEVHSVVRELVADAARVRSMGEAALAVTDGRGSGRVADAIEELVTAEGVTGHAEVLRRA